MGGMSGGQGSFGGYGQGYGGYGGGGYGQQNQGYGQNRGSAYQNYAAPRGGFGGMGSQGGFGGMPSGGFPNQGPMGQSMPRAVGSPADAFGKGPMTPEMSKPYSVQEQLPRTGGMTPGPMMQRPTQDTFAPQQPTKQAPPGYYYAANGQMLLGQDPKASAPSSQAPNGNIYGGGQPGQYGTPGYVPGSGNQQMLDIYSQQRQASMGQPAPFGRYPDGTPMADPNVNFRANDRQGRYGGGWDY